MIESLVKFEIKVSLLPEDIYKAVGQIIWLAQEWESEMKKLARVVGVPDGKNKAVEEFSLDRLNKALKSEKIHIISGNMYNNLEEIIKARNYINHKFFLDREQEQPRKTAEELTEYFTDIATLINEARDYIANVTREIERKGLMIKVPTIFDK